uniref:DnaJ homolog subfamily C member 8 n=1 Tax=Bos taurus TaxID=9913 RepID=A0AAA9SZA4_BOVIN
MGRRRTLGRDAWGQLTIEEGLEGRERSRAGVPRASPEVSLLFGLLSFSEGPTGVPDRARTGPNIISLRRERGALVKQIEKRDSVLTSKNQIERLTRPGSSYFNLNPFEVLQIDPEVTDEEIKKRFRQLSILVHPDKNQDDADRAQKAFEAVDKAYKLLLDQEQKKRALDVIQAGKEYVEHTVKERKKQLKKEGKPTNVEEDDPELFKQAVYKQTMKLFAELEIKRKEREAKEMHERKRQREEEIEAQEKAKREREWQKNFEESRDGRVDSWRNFQANTKGKKEKKNRTFLRPPKVKMEQRE